MRPKTNKQCATFSLDKAVLETLIDRCHKSRIPVSEFVNTVLKRIVMSEYEFHRQKSVELAAELAKHQLLRDSAPDSPMKVNIR